MQNKKLQVWLPLLFSLVMIAGMVIGYRIKENMGGRGFFYLDKRRPVEEVLNLIETKYVDKVMTDSIADDAISSLLAKLDPHSVFLPVSQLQEAKEDLEGRFFGIGVEYNMIDDTINVVNVVKGGPSEKAGLLVGDKLIKIDDSLVAGKNIASDRVRQLLRGATGSKVSVTLIRGNTPKSFTIIRGMIPLYSLDASYMLNDSTGFIRLNKFSETTYNEFINAVEKLKKSGMRNMVLDLRDNGGGILTEATDIADEFLEGEKLITYTEGAHSAKKEYRTKRNGIFESGKVVVLANELTASASEVLIGALQDWDRATVIGRRTFGKGLVQEQYTLNDGSGVRLTVARYYTPLGRSIQKSYMGGSAAYRNELHDRMNDGELLYADSIKHLDGKVYKTPGGKTVYSGGGITPDIFVAYDTSGYNSKLGRIYSGLKLNEFIYRYYVGHQQQFSFYKTPLEFEKNYSVDPATWESLNAYVTGDSININSFNPKQKQAVQRQIEILLARQIWRNEGLYEVSNVEDSTVKKALEVLK